MFTPEHVPPCFVMFQNTSSAMLRHVPDQMFHHFLFCSTIFGIFQNACSACTTMLLKICSALFGYNLEHMVHHVLDYMFGQVPKHMFRNTCFAMFYHFPTLIQKRVFVMFRHVLQYSKAHIPPCSGMFQITTVSGVHPCW